jgi:hypothetical protein
MRGKTRMTNERRAHDAKTKAKLSLGLALKFGAPGRI